MQTYLTTATAALLVLAGSVQAQESPGVHFMENWDLDSDGQVTLAEAEEKRGEIFYMFDQDENGELTPEEYDLFDEMRSSEQEMMAETRQAMGMGGQGQGRGQGMRGHGRGQGQGGGMGGQGYGQRQGRTQPGYGYGQQTPGAGGMFCGQWTISPQGWFCSHMMYPGQMQPPGRMGMGRQGMGGQQGMQGQPMQRTTTDLDGDGVVTREEFLAGTNAWFENRDRNDDGVLTIADFGAGR